MKNRIYKTLAPIILFLPLITSAEEKLENVKEIASGAKGIVGILIPLAFGLAVAAFFFGIAKYIWSEGSGKDEGKTIMTWGVVAMFVMVSIWGIVVFVRDQLGIGDASTLPMPTIGGGGDDCPGYGGSDCDGT